MRCVVDNGMRPSLFTVAGRLCVRFVPTYEYPTGALWWLVVSRPRDCGVQCCVSPAVVVDGVAAGAEPDG